MCRGSRSTGIHRSYVLSLTVLERAGERNKAAKSAISKDALKGIMEKPLGWKPSSLFSRLLRGFSSSGHRQNAFRYFERIHGKISKKAYYLISEDRQSLV